MLAILTGGNLLGDFVILQKGNIMYIWPSVIDWLIFGNFHLDGFAELTNIELKNNYDLTNK